MRGRPCGICGTSEDEANMLVCDKCESCFHSQCVSTAEGYTKPNDGPWYCRRCRTHIIMHGHSDLIEDLPLLDLLFLGKEPQGVDDADRV